MYDCHKHLPYIWAYFLFEYMLYGFSSYKLKPLQNKSINLCWAQVCGKIFSQLKKNASELRIRNNFWDP